MGQSQVYRDSVFIPELKARVAVEAGVSQGWERWVGDQGTTVTVNRFGASAPYKVMFEKYGLTVDHVISAARETLR